MKYGIGALQMLVLNTFAFNAKGQSEANSQTLAISDYTLKKKEGYLSRGILLLYI